jgi:hypothetical protein
MYEVFLDGKEVKIDPKPVENYVGAIEDIKDLEIRANDKIGLEDSDCDTLILLIGIRDTSEQFIYDHVFREISDVLEARSFYKWKNKCYMYEKDRSVFIETRERGDDIKSYRSDGVLAVE